MCIYIHVCVFSIGISCSLCLLAHCAYPCPATHASQLSAANSSSPSPPAPPPGPLPPTPLGTSPSLIATRLRTLLTIDKAWRPLQGHQLIDLEKWEREEGGKGGRGKKRTARRGKKEGDDRQNDTDENKESRTGKESRSGRTLFASMAQGASARPSKKLRCLTLLSLEC